jgi:DNA-binding response OmpR family regulator
MKTIKILVAEDDPALLHSFRVRLESQGYEVLCAQNGHQAVAMAGLESPDLLLLDVHLPAGDGFSVERRVHNMPNMSNVPIIYVTGDRSQEMLDKANELGVRMLLKKPFNTMDLLQTVRFALESVERQGAPVGAA